MLLPVSQGGPWESGGEKQKTHRISESTSIGRVENPRCGNSKCTQVPLPLSCPRNQHLRMPLPIGTSGQWQTLLGMVSSSSEEAPPRPSNCLSVRRTQLRKSRHCCFVFQELEQRAGTMQMPGRRRPKPLQVSLLHSSSPALLLSHSSLGAGGQDSVPLWL